METRRRAKLRRQYNCIAPVHIALINVICIQSPSCTVSLVHRAENSSFKAMLRGIRRICIMYMYCKIS